MWHLALGLIYGITSLPLNRLVGHTMTTESWARNVQKCIDIRIISITTLSAYLQSYLVNDQPRSWPVRLMCRNDNDAEHKGEYDYRTKTTKQRASNNGIPFFSCFVNFGREMGTVAHASLSLLAHQPPRSSASPVESIQSVPMLHRI